MRSVLTLAAVLAAGAGAVAEELPGITLPPRYGVTPNPEFYPQGTPKEALATAAKLMEKQRYSYLLAHVVDPAFVDSQVAARAQQLEPAVEKRLATVREGQKRSLPADTPADRIVPSDPAGFADKVRAEATQQAFADLVKAMQDHLSEFPEQVKQLAALRDTGTIGEAPPTAFAEAKSVPGKTVFLKQVTVACTKEAKMTVDNMSVTVQQPASVQRWFLEDRQQDEEKPKKDK